ncbi:MAG: FeS assembly SUF system protein, partial [Kiritimatiellia bacterium]
ELSFDAGDWSSESAAVDEPVNGVDEPINAVDEPVNGVDAALSSNDDPFGGSVSQGEYFPTPAPVVVEVVPPQVDAPEVANEEVVERVSAASIEPPSGDPLESDEQQDLEEQVVAQMRTIFDPEIPIDIYELGLIYDVIVSSNRDVQVNMTLTSPNCPAAQELPAEVELKAVGVDGIRHAFVDIVWDPPWGPHLMSEAAKLELNIL